MQNFRLSEQGLSMWRKGGKSPSESGGFFEPRRLFFVRMILKVLVPVFDFRSAHLWEARRLARILYTKLLDVDTFSTPPWADWVLL